MLYAIPCYNDEAAVEAWPKAKDDAVIAKRRTVTDKLAGTNVAHKVSEVVEAVSSTVTQGLSRS